MASPPHPEMGIVRGDSQASTIVAAAASSTIELHKTSFDCGDVEACGSDNVTVVQELSIIKRGKSTLVLILKRIWCSICMLLVSLRLFWCKREVNEQRREKSKEKLKISEFWAELPKKIQHHRVSDYVEGIPQLAALMSSDDNFCICRSFGQLQSRMLIHRQLELHALEEELNELDKKDDEDDELRYRLRIADHHDAWDPAQKNLTDKIFPKLVEYYDLVLKIHAIKSIPEATKSNYQSVLNWIWKFQPIDEDHNGFIFKSRDFVLLGRSPQNEAFHERLLCWIGSWPKFPLNKIFRDPKQCQDTAVHYYSSSRLGFLIRAFVIFLVISILMVPILILYMVPMPNSNKAVVVLLALFVFAISLSQFRDSKPQDLFFGTATYCAVLLVFLATNQAALAASQATS